MTSHLPPKVPEPIHNKVETNSVNLSERCEKLKEKKEINSNQEHKENSKLVLPPQQVPNSEYVPEEKILNLEQ